MTPLTQTDNFLGGTPTIHSPSQQPLGHFITSLLTLPEAWMPHILRLPTGQTGGPSRKIRGGFQQESARRNSASQFKDQDDTLSALQEQRTNPREQEDTPPQHLPAKGRKNRCTP